MVQALFTTLLNHWIVRHVNAALDLLRLQQQPTKFVWPKGQILVCLFLEFLFGRIYFDVRSFRI